MRPAQRQRIMTALTRLVRRVGRTGKRLAAAQRLRMMTMLPRVVVASVIVMATVGLALRLSGQAPATEPGPPFAGPVTADVPEEEPPVAAATRFLAAWERGQYREMYGMLSTAAKKTISEAQFVRFYSDITKQGAFVRVSVQVDRLALGSTALRVEERKRKPQAAATATPAPAVGRNAPKPKATPTPLPQVAIPIQTTFETTQMGRFTERNTLPVVQEGNAWKIAWTPDTLLKDLQVKGRVRLALKDGTALRGRLLDRNGNPLAWSEQVFKVGVVPARINDEATLLSVVSELTGMTREAVKAKYNKQPQSWLIPIGEIPVSKRAEVESRLQNLGGIVVNETMRRRYAEPGLAGPVLGLVGEYGPMDEQSLAGKGYRDGDWIGRTGVEQAVELDVAGVRGGSLGLVAPDGGWVRLLSQQPRRDGKDVLLTLDRELQRAAEEAMTGETLRGAVVVLEIASRQVLAAVSRPGYDPGAVAADIHDQRWRWGVMDSSSQFANRTAALYPLTQVTTVLSAGTAELARALGLGGPESAIGLPPLPADQRPGSGVAASPLQLAALMAALAGDGRLRMPVLAQEVCDADGTVEKTLLPKDSGPLPLLPAQTEALRREVARLSPKTNVTAGPSEDAYAEAGPDGPVLPATPAWGPVWYAGYAPAEQPRYVVVGLAEYGQQDGLTVASAVQALLQRLGG